MTTPAPLLRATVLVSVAHYMTLAITVLTQFAFARLMTPAEIGAYAVAFGISELVGAVVDLPINRAVIARLGGREASGAGRTELGTAWVLVVGQMLLFLGLSAIAWGVSAAGIGGVNSRVGGLIAWLLVAKGVSKPGFVATAVDEHHVRFGTLSIATLVTAVIAGFSGVFGAWRGMGGIAICLRDAVGAFLYTGSTVWIFRSRVTFEWNAREAAALLRYSVRMAVSGFTDRLVNQVDTLLLARTLDLSTVGVYSYARRLVALAINTGMPAIQRVLFAAYASSGSAESGTNLHRTSARWIFGVGVSGVALLVLFPREIVRVAFGATFSEASVPLAWLAPLLLVSLLAENDRTLLAAQGLFRGMLVVRNIQCVGVALAVLIAARSPAVAVIAASAIVVVGEMLAFVVTRVFVVEHSIAVSERGIPVLTLVATSVALAIASTGLAKAPLLHRTAGVVVGPLLAAAVLSGTRLTRSEAR